MTAKLRAATDKSEVQYEEWAHWPVNWSAVWVGALAAVGAVLLFGLIGIAVGAHVLDPDQRVVDLKKIVFWQLAFSVFASFLAFVIGGWVCARIAGILRAEDAAFHGAIAFLVAVPMLVVLVALGAGTSFGAWHAALVVKPQAAPYERPAFPATGITPEERQQYQAAVEKYRQNLEQWQKDTPKVTRNSAIGAATALLLGLIGSVIGGWMASGEPMTFSHYRTPWVPR